MAAWLQTNWAVRAIFIGWAVSLLVMSAAYTLGAPGLLLKRADGRRHPASWVIHWPYHAMSALSLLLFRASRRPAYAEVAPGLFLGRRLTSREAAAVPARSVLDLACELPENAVM